MTKILVFTIHQLENGPAGQVSKISKLSTGPITILKLNWKEILN